MNEVQRSVRPGFPISGAGERRLVIVMFTDVVGFTPLTEELGEEGVFSLIQQLAGEQAAIITRHGGFVQDFAGDGLVALFGAPVALENAPLRAFRAAIEIHGKVQSLDTELTRLGTLRAARAPL